MDVSSSEPLQLTHGVGVRKVILHQYILHEVRHHPPVESQGRETTAVTPLAHAMADIYKFLHQGTFGYGPAGGVKHIPSPEFFREHLANDYYRVEPAANAPILEPVTLDDSILRINLRPYRSVFERNEDRGFYTLEKVVLDSSMIEKGSPENLFVALSVFEDLNNKEELSIESRSYVIPPRMVDGFLRELESFIRSHGVLPLLSHSEAYHRLNRPSYVVADLAVLERSSLAFLLQQPTP